MKTKFELGESVHCNFIGEVKEIKELDGKILYMLTFPTELKHVNTMVFNVQESYLTRLEQPEDFKDPNPDHERP